MIKCLTTVVALIGLFVGPALAHHSAGATFDLQQEVELAGVVTRYEWKNPHVYFYIMVSAPGRAQAEWEVEAGPVAFMHRFGWGRETLTPGVALRIKGNPSKSGDHEVLLIGAQTADGKQLPATRGRDVGEMFANPVNEGQQASSLEGTWITAVVSGVVGRLEEPGQMPLTSKGIEAAANFDERTMHPGLTCTPIPAPMLMVIPDTKRIEVTADKVTIYSDFDGTRRTIYLDDQDLHENSVHGYSSGALGHGVLTIDTENFSPVVTGIAFGVPSGPNKKLKERLVLAEDRRSLVYWFEMTDQDYLTEPVTGEVRWSYQPDATLTGLQCDPANASLFVKHQ
jgi:hypothetical protein